MTALHRLGSRLSAYVSAVATNPPLLGLAVGVWLAVLSFFVAANPIVTFLLVAPSAMILWYGVLYGARRFGGESLGGKSLAESTASFPSIRAADADGDRALARLRERYADGEIDHEEFERRLDALVETETHRSESAAAAPREASVVRER